MARVRNTRPVLFTALTTALVALSCSSAPNDAADAAFPGQVDGSASSGATDADGGVGDSGSATPDAAVVGGGEDHCGKATVISLSTPRSELHADTTKATHDVDIPCAADSGPDVFYQFTASRPLVVYADTFGASWNTVLFLLGANCEPLTTSTMLGDAVCSDDACGTTQSRLVALVAPGNYRIGVGGRGGAGGTATVHFEFVLAASGAEAELPQGVSEQSGTTHGESGNVQEEGCVAAGPEDGYWWATCPADPGGQLKASTCGGATWETLLSTEMPRANTYACSLGSCNLQTELVATVAKGAGLHHLVVDGQGAVARGPYLMQVTRP